MSPTDPRSLVAAVRADLQRIVDLAARLTGTSAGLVNCRDGGHLEVGVAAATADAPFAPGLRLALDAPGVYCATVIRSGEPLVVPDALRAAPWRDDPAGAPALRSYLGFPVRDPEGEMLGTICVLDRGPRAFGPEQVELLERLRDLAERHLAVVWLNASLGDDGRDLAAYRRELLGLRRLLPICAGCKSIRDEQGAWRALESYFAAAAGATFTHGLCPDCLREHYPELEAGG